jgi:hypothetical protein
MATFALPSMTLSFYGFKGKIFCLSLPKLHNELALLLRTWIGHDMEFKNFDKN